MKEEEVCRKTEERGDEYMYVKSTEVFSLQTHSYYRNLTCTAFSISYV